MDKKREDRIEIDRETSSKIEIAELDKLYWFMERKSKTATRENIYVMTMVSRKPRQLLGCVASRDKAAGTIQQMVDSSAEAKIYCTDGYIGYLCPGPGEADNRLVWQNSNTKELLSVPRRSRFTREEKIAAVNLVLEGRRPRGVANEYGVHENTIYKWRLEFETDPDEAFTQQAGQDGADEVGRLKRRVKELELEVEFLKKRRHASRKARAEVCLDVVFPGKHIYNPHNKSDTFTVEGVSADLRHCLPMLARHSRCFLRKLENLQSVLTVFAEAYNRFGSEKQRWRTLHPESSASSIPFSLFDFL